MLFKLILRFTLFFPKITHRCVGVEFMNLGHLGLRPVELPLPGAPNDGVLFVFEVLFGVAFPGAPRLLGLGRPTQFH